MTDEVLEPDVDDVLDDSVSALFGTDIAEVELPDFDPTDFEGDENADN